MEKNKTGKYFKYAIGEIVLVVIGILIALSINNWNENIKEDDKRQGYYNQLIDDINKDLEFTNSTIEDFDNYNRQYLNNLENYSNEKIGLNELYNKLIKIKINSTALTFNSSTMESLVNSGDIELIEPELRNRLIDLGRNQELIIKRFEFTNKGKNEIVQNASLIFGSPQMQDNLKKHNGLKELRMENNMSQLILALEGTHRWKYLSQIEALEGLKEMQNELREIVEIINKQVKK